MGSPPGAPGNGGGGNPPGGSGKAGGWPGISGGGACPSPPPMPDRPGIPGSGGRPPGNCAAKPGAPGIGGGNGGMPGRPGGGGNPGRPPGGGNPNGGGGSGCPGRAGAQVTVSQQRGRTKGRSECLYVEILGLPVEAGTQTAQVTLREAFQASLQASAWFVPPLHRSS